MRKDFFPDREVEMVGWCVRFSQQVSEQYAALNVPAETAAAYAAVVAELVAAFGVASEPATRTMGAVAQKNQCLRTAEAMSRNLAKLVGANVDLSAEQRVSLGLNLRKQAVRKIEPPERWPTVVALRVDGARVDVRLETPGGPVKRARPSNAASAAIFACVSDERPATGAAGEDNWRYLCTSTRTATMIDFGAKYRPGTRVWFMARWMSPRGEASADGAATSVCLGEGAAKIGMSDQRMASAA